MIDKNDFPRIKSLEDLELLISDEAEMRARYYNFLAIYGTILTDEQIHNFEKIFDEKAKHAEILNKMIMENNKIGTEHE